METFTVDQTEVDLHILVVPSSQWRPDLRLAYSSTCMASVSAGFVRVDPAVSLRALRKEISKQLDSTCLPHSYIFLRNVGRYLCIVSRNQELSLISKLFVPPLAPCPEIYLLEADLAEFEEVRDMSPQLPGPHYSPQASQPPSIQLTHLASTTPAPISHDHSLLAHKHGSLQPLNAPMSSQAAIHSSSQQSGKQAWARMDSEPVMPSSTPQQHQASSSQQSGKQTGARMDSEPVMQSSTQQQHQASSTLSYQPRNDDKVEDYKSHPGVCSPIDDPLTEEDGEPNEQDCKEGSPTSIPHHQKARHKQKVHFESLTKLAVEEHNISSHSFRGFGKPKPENEHRVFATSASVSHGTGKSHTVEHDFVSKSAAVSLSGFSPHKHLPPIPESGSESEEILPPSSSSQPHEVNMLLAKIRQVKDESKHLSSQKESLSTTARHLQHRLKTRKEDDDSEWKQKLAKEKKLTRTLKKSIQKLRTELKAVDRVGKPKKPSKKTFRDDLHRNEAIEKSESDHSNMKLECRRVDVGMEDLRRTLDEEKRKFKLEQEKHQSTTDECKTLKKELIQRKIAYNREKKK